MKVAKWIAVVSAGGLLLSFGSCAVDLGYYVLNTLGEYMPDILDALNGTAT